MNFIGILIMLRCAENYLLVKIDKRFRDEDGGISLDPTWTPEEYVTQSGIVYSVPLRYVEDDSRPTCGDVKPGDKIWFSYSILFDYEFQPEFGNPVYKNLIEVGGEEYWKVHRGEVFCKDENGKIEMLTKNVLLKPIKSTEKVPFEIQYENLKSLGEVVSVPENSLSCNMRDVVCVEEKYIQKYNIMGGEHYIVPVRKVLATI